MIDADVGPHHHGGCERLQTRQGSPVAPRQEARLLNNDLPSSGLNSRVGSPPRDRASCRGATGLPSEHLLCVSLQAPPELCARRSGLIHKRMLLHVAE